MKTRPDSLKNKTIVGVGWSAIDNLAQYAVTFIVSIVLARLLSPEDYGLIGLITIFIAISNALVNGGFPDALIRKQEVTEADYNTSFFVNFAISVLLYFILFLVSPLIATFFRRNELILLTRVASLGIIIGSLTLVQQTILTKKVDFRTQTKITLISSISSGIISVIMALMGFGVWALVAQGLLKQLFSAILLWLYNRWVPKFEFSLSSFNQLFGFGWKITLSHLLNTVWEEMNQVVVGRFYNPVVLGQYTRAKQFSMLFSSNLTNVVQRVSFPVLSDIQNQKERMIAAYRRIIKVTMLITAFCSLLLAAISEPLLFCLIGPKWHDAATYLPFICLSASLYPLHAINLNMLKVQGRSDLFLSIEIVKKIVAIIPLLLGASFGIFPMLYSGIAVSIVYFFLNSSFSGKLLGYSSFMQIKDIMPSFIIATVIAALVWPFKFLPLSNWIILPIQILLSIGLFIVICRITKQAEYYELEEIVKVFFRKMYNKNVDNRSFPV